TMDRRTAQPEQCPARIERPAGSIPCDSLAALASNQAQPLTVPRSELKHPRQVEDWLLEHDTLTRCATRSTSALKPLCWEPTLRTTTSPASSMDGASGASRKCAAG